MKHFEQIFLNNLRKQSVKESLIPNDWLQHSNEFIKRNDGLSENVDLIALNGTNFIMDFPDNTFSEKIGIHPDFFNKKNAPFNQYVCSIFMDISGSTNLALEYDLTTVQQIKNAILSSGIYIIKGFGGHIHRLQGDALFAFTGHSKMTKSDAILQALNASASIQYFNSKILHDYFTNDLKVDPPKIRIGIDFGDDNEVLWSNYGISDINEFTVTSIHSDLASKLQHKAPKNSVMLGENVYRYLNLPPTLLKDKSYIKDGKKEKEYYIIDNHSVRYGMKIFNWSEYLNKISHFENEKDNPFHLKDPKHFKIKGFYTDTNTKKQIPFFSQVCLDKNLLLRFELDFINPAYKNLVKGVEWKVINYGYEAEVNNDAQPFSLEEYRDKFSCVEYTAYNVMHYLECTLYNNQKNIIGKSHFSVFIHDNLMDNLNLNVLREVK